MSNAMKNLKARMAYRAKLLLDPNWEGPRVARDDAHHHITTPRYFPDWHPGMTTETYIELFQQVNHHTRPSSKLTFSHRPGVPAQEEA